MGGSDPDLIRLRYLSKVRQNVFNSKKFESWLYVPENRTSS